MAAKKSNTVTVEELLIDVQQANKDVVKTPKKVKSDGGSTSYYQLEITNKAGETIKCETGDVIRSMVGNDFDLGNIIKACRRMYEASEGRGKEGIDLSYDANKVAYFAKEFAQWH